jgi:hypothetical protein
MAYSKLENGLNYTIMIRFFRFFSSRMNKLVYIYVPNEFVIGQVVLKLLSKRLALAMMSKTLGWISNGADIQIVNASSIIYD